SLAKPSLVGPIGSTSSDTPTFAWNPVTGADHYDVWVNDLTTGQSAVLRKQDVAGTSLAATLPLTPGHSYRWWVRPVDASNTNVGPWSAAADFFVAFLGWPSLVGPASSTNNDNPAFIWNGVA